MSDELVTDRKYVVKWCNALRKSVGVGSTSRLARGFRMYGMDPISLTLWGVGVRSTVAEGDLVYLGGVRSEDAQRWVKDRTVERYRSFEEPVVARFLRNFDAGLYPELGPKPQAISAD